MIVRGEASCPMCGALIELTGSVDRVSANERVEPIDRTPMVEHFATEHPGVKATWGSTPTYPHGAG